MIIGKDIPFEKIDGHLLKLIDFKSQEKGFFIPYAYATVEGTAFEGQAVLPVFQRTDFKNLTEAWKQKKREEEVLVFWSVKNYSSRVFKLFQAILPKLWMRLCPKDSYKIESDQKFKPELKGEARYLAVRAIREWKPSVFGV